MALPPASIALAAARAHGSGSQEIAASRPAATADDVPAVPIDAENTPSEDDLTNARLFIRSFPEDRLHPG
jgi:hypothetical protein